MNRSMPQRVRQRASMRLRAGSQGTFRGASSLRMGVKGYEVEAASLTLRDLSSSPCKNTVAVSEQCNYLLQIFLKFFFREGQGHEFIFRT